MILINNNFFKLNSICSTNQFSIYLNFSFCCHRSRWFSTGLSRVLFFNSGSINFELGEQIPYKGFTVRRIIITNTKVKQLYLTRLGLSFYMFSVVATQLPTFILNYCAISCICYANTTIISFPNQNKFSPQVLFSYTVKPLLSLVSYPLCQYLTRHQFDI